MGCARIIACYGEAFSCDRRCSVGFQFPVLDQGTDARHAWWEIGAVLPRRTWDLDKNAGRQVLQDQVLARTLLDGSDVVCMQSPIEHAPSGVFEEAKRFQVRQRLGDPDGHVGQQRQKPHDAACGLIVSLQPIFFACPKFVLVRVWVGVEQGCVLRHRPEQQVVLLCGHPASTQQSCDVLSCI